MAGLKLPPGFRFHPTDLELVTYYLKRKVHGLAMDYDIVAEVDLYKCEPWDLPDKSLIGNRDPQWYFYCARDKKYANGSRTNRATEAGYWKATGKDRAVKNSKRIVGMKKTLVFYRGRAPHGERTDWVMHEYRLEEGEFSKVKLQDAFVLCRVLKKTGIGANNPEYNSASLDIEEVDTTIKEDILLPDESSLFPQWQGLASPVDALTNENAFVGSECPILSVPSKFLNAQDAIDHDKSIFNTNLLNDLNQSLDTFNTLAGPTSELAKLDTVPNSEDLASLMTAQDLALSLEAPDFSCGLGATTSVSFNHFNVASNYSHEEADILDELYRSTLQSQGSKKPFEEGQVVSLAPLNGTEVSEEDIMEELLQLINQSRAEGQQSYAEEQRSLVGAKFQDDSTVSDLEDALFDFLEEPNVDILTNAWNETATSQFEVEDAAVKPCTDRTKNWFNDSLVSVHDLPSFSEALPDFLSMQTTHNSFEEQAKAEPRTDMNHINDPLEGSTSTAAYFLGLQDDILKPSSRFSRLLDSIPVLPASAAEFPHLIHKTNVKSKYFSIATPDQNFSSMQMAAWNASFTAMNFRVVMQGSLQSSALEGSKHEVSILKDKTKSSTNALIYELVPENSSKGCCFRGRGNSCFSIMFLLGALSALCWFLLLRFAWRLASYMGCLVL